MTGLLRLRTDFNDLYSDMAAVLIETVNGLLPNIGDIVLLYDADANTCQGRVVEIAAGLIYVDPDWDTWVNGDQVDFGPTDDLLRALTASVRSQREDAETEGFAEDFTKTAA
jgi:hypothetical protein